MSEVELAISKDVFLQLDQLPKKTRKKFVEFVEKFQENPKSPAIHYEAIHNFRDERARTVRIGDDYRGIIVSPRTGNRHLLVWIDHHDEAMAWAKNKIFDVNPATGVLQMVDVAQAEAALEPKKKAKGASEDWTGSFAHCNDTALITVGVPEVLLPSLRRITDEKSFYALAPHLPEEVRELLEWVVLMTCSLEQALEFCGTPKPVPPKNPDDFGPALENPETQRRFVTLRSGAGLEGMLNAPMVAWRVFLHPDQRRLAHQRFNGSARVLGGAGTGKTVLAMHRARFLADEVFKGTDDRILFTTFSKSLAADIRENLKTLCDGEVHPRIEVVHLHSWAVRFLARGGARLQVATDADRRAAWKAATGTEGASRFTQSFIEDEWTDVVQQQGLRSKDEYLRANRRGRAGPRLRKQDREELWAIFDAYRRSLDDHERVEFPDVIRMAREKLEAGAGDLPFRAAVVDETQDFGSNELRLIRAMIPRGPDDLFLVGDAHQRIYAQPVVLSSCEIDIRGRGKKLRVNYRTTHEIRKFATAALKGVVVDDLDGQQDDLQGYTSLLAGPEPGVTWAKSQDDEAANVAVAVRSLLDGGAEASAIALVAPAAWLLEKVYVAALRTAGVATSLISGEESGTAGDGVRLCTMHRCKGLEFRHVLIAGLGDTRFPHPPDTDQADDRVLARQQESAQRSLFFVAATRARETLRVSGWGTRGVLP